MQNDDITWSIIGRHHCSYKMKTETQSFCRNEYNVTGLCNRRSCPLANSKYATVREQKGILYLYIRDSEKIYKPCEEWKKVRLSKTFIKSLQQIEDNLVFWPMYFKQKCRQRVFKITQYLARMRKMKLNNTKKLVPIRQKDERRLAKREEKALIAAKLDFAIEKQLLNRLKEGTYERIYNFPKKAFNIHLDEAEEDVLDEELDEEDEEETERVRVKEEEGEEIDEEFQQELQEELVRQRREDSDSASDGSDSGDEDGEIEHDIDSDDESIEQDMESEEEEEDEQEMGKVEYVADFDESDEEDLVSDIEEAAAKLNLGKASKDKKHSAGASASRPVGGSVEIDSSDDERNETISRKKYGPKKPVKPSAKFGIKRKANKQKLRDIYEKQKNAAREKKTMKMKR